MMSLAVDDRRTESGEWRAYCQLQRRGRNGTGVQIAATDCAEGGKWKEFVGEWCGSELNEFVKEATTMDRSQVQVGW
jgi:hypothetical protein